MGFQSEAWSGVTVGLVGESSSKSLYLNFNTDIKAAISDLNNLSRSAAQMLIRKAYFVLFNQTKPPIRRSKVLKKNLEKKKPIHEIPKLLL